ncbi:MAG: WYL domain-containing protein [Clostridiales bacterium]|nr:WYL domain-containing protein [Clostridiales bacterium]MBO4580377.1 WYL domain-containing protein [Clostridiales bacterium]
MANSDDSKIKILFLYDFFMTRLNSFDDDSSVSMAELLDFLEKETGTRFERKSVYSDIKRLNDFMRKTGRLKNDKNDDWIYKEKKRYRVGELESQISADEALLLVDAIKTTAFTNSGIAGKLKMMFPSYFTKTRNTVSLVANDRKYPQRLISYVNTFRSCIEEWSVVSFNYGYKLGTDSASNIREKRSVTPLALDWDNNIYYLIAIDNEEYDRNEGTGKPAESSIKRFRIDRLDGVNRVDNEKYRGYSRETERNAAVKNYKEHSVSAYSADEFMTVEIKMSFVKDGTVRPDANPWKEILRACSILQDHVTIKRIISESQDKGELVFAVETVDVPTFYAYLFETGNVPGIKVEIRNDLVREKYRTYLENALNAL